MPSLSKGSLLARWIDPNAVPRKEDFDYNLDDTVGALHVLPTNDVRRHYLDESCWCSPEVDWDADELVWVHNAADRRDGDPH